MEASSPPAKRRKCAKRVELMRLQLEIVGKEENDDLVHWMRKKPGLLVTECSLPTILVDLLRLNPVHLAAKTNNNWFLSRALGLLVVNKNITKASIPKDEDTAKSSRIMHIIDRYLNTPCEVLGDTPLHLAAKHLSLNCMKVLVSHPLTDINFKNCEGKTPFEVIGDCADRDSDSFEFERQKKIAQGYLKNHFFIPIWRDESGFGSRTVQLGVPATIQQLGRKTPRCVHSFFTKTLVKYLPECSEHVMPRPLPADGIDTTIPSALAAKKWVISSIIGPVTAKEADHIKALIKGTKLGAGKLVSNRLLSTPEIINKFFPKNVYLNNNSILASDQVLENLPSESPTTSSGENSPMSSCSSQDSTDSDPLITSASEDVNIRLTDPNGLERIAQKYCEELHVSFYTSEDIRGCE